MEVSSEDVVGKHLARRAGFHTGGWDPGASEAERNESAGCTELRLPPPRALTCTPSDIGLKRVRTRTGGLEREGARD